MVECCKVKLELMVEVRLEKVNHGELKFTMVNGTASVTPNFQFTMVNLTLVSCSDNSGKNKVDLTPDNNLVTKKKRWVHLLSIQTMLILLSVCHLFG